MVPYHVQVYVHDSDVFRGFFYKSGTDFELRMELPDSTFVDGGRWPSIGDADTAARAMLPDLARRPEVVRSHSVLHIYIRHRRDAQSYGNDWIDDFRLRSITTYETVAEFCRRAIERGDRIRVHRRKFEKIPATICCECTVKSVDPIEGTNGFKVEFQDWASLSIERDKRLQQGYYFDFPSNYEEAEECNAD